MSASAELTLLYGTLKVGDIREAFCSDATWYGVFKPTIRPHDGDLAQRLLDFIAFCEDWNERVRRSSTGMPDAAVFDCFDDITRSGFWATETQLGQKSRIANAPVFFLGGEISWRV